MSELATLEEPIIVVEMPKALPLKKFVEVFGVTARAIEGKIKRETWTDGVEYLRDPDNKIHVIIEGYEKWLYRNTPKPLQRASESMEKPSLSILDGMASDTAQLPSISQPRKVSRPQPLYEDKLSLR